ncbi:MAG: serine/threonine protein kinase, partial [Chloroflexi bacterium]|nr:serine/threonine protein kinase [Chloroflexota bacterium]
MPDWIGKTLGKVRIVELLARGGMAEVYLGEHTTLNRKVAVKIMREHIDADPDNRKRFEREAHVVANLSHPNIIQVFDYEIVDGQPCLIMELVPGASLGNYMKAMHKRGERLPFEVVSKLLTSLASAIDYAHEKGIIHRDIKPANVLLRSASGLIDPEQPLPADVEPILTDFGLVRLLDSSVHTSTGTVSGTPTYMSPEQARGDSVDSRSDIYSLGVMLYEMLAGAVPFDAESSFGILMKHLNEPPPPIEDISTDLQAVITRALSKDPQFRYPTAKEMVDDYIAVFNGQTISASTITAMKMAEKAAEQSKQPRSSSWAWVVVGATVILAAAFIVLRRQPPATNPPTSQPIIVTQTPLPTSTPIVDVPLGHASYADQNAIMDKATISLADLPAPEAGSH